MASRHAAQHLLLQVFATLINVHAWSPQPPTYQIVASDGKRHKSLYPQNGPVEPLIGSAANNMLYQDPSVIWLVEYYDSSCPHCWYFSGILPTVAKAIKSPKVRIGAFNCIENANNVACQTANVLSYPALKLYNFPAAGNSHDIHVHSEGDIEKPMSAQEIATSLTNLAPGRITILHPEVFHSGAGLSSGGNLVSPSGPPGRTGWTQEPWGSLPARFHDAHIGMARLLMDGYINATKYQAALDVVKFVGRAFGKDESQAFTDLTTRLQAKPDLQPVQFRNIMTDWAQQFNTSWVFCKTKTCAVWQLFHGISALIAIKYAAIPVAESLPKFRFMVDNFLDCAVCRQHFLRAYDACLFGRCEVLSGGDEVAQAKAQVLWLWRTHNAVNVRVISEHPPTGKAVDRRWPSFADCPGCWNTTVVNGENAAELTFQGQMNHDQPVYNVFSEQKVFGFILYTYLGEESKKKETRLFHMPSLSLGASQATSTRSGWMILAMSCAVAGISIFFLVVRRFGLGWKEHTQRSRDPTGGQDTELLVDLETIE